MSQPTIIFGTGLLGMTLAGPNELPEALKALRKGGVSHIDTAARYPPIKSGESERLLGQSRAAENGFKIDTKILAANVDGSGELGAEAIANSIKDSLERLQIKQIDTIYCHRADLKTPLVETAAALNDQYEKGAFKKWGVCRFEPEQLEELLNICEEKGYVKPSVYQGEYNVVTRAAEDKILPILRANSMKFYAHRPFATGFLTGKFTNGNVEGTRFAEDFALNFVFRKEYGDQELHHAIRQLEKTLEPHGIACHEAALRWIMFHSALGAGDGVIFGSSKIMQIEDNVKSINRGPLPQSVASSMEELWGKYAKQTRSQLL